MTLPAGLHSVPAGHVAAVVTYLEMSAPTITTPVPFPKGIGAAREQLTVAEYQQLYRRIGTPWLWQSRLRMTPDALEAVLRDTDTETWVVRASGDAIGLVELDFQTPGACELGFFGLIPTATGQGLGRAMIGLAQAQAFARPITRFHVQTCTFDAPQALGFYQTFGFRAYKRGVEICSDPRLDGTLPPDAAGHIPCLK